VPEIEKAGKVPFGAVQPMIATGNTTVLTDGQLAPEYSDAEKALMVLTLMSFAQGGKKADNSVVLSKGYQGKAKDNGKPVTAKGGPALGFLGYLHSFLLGPSLIESLWLNVFTNDTIQGLSHFSAGLGVPAWERMPSGEFDEVAREMRESLAGRLVPLSRFVLLAEDGIHYSEGILYPTYKEGSQDPSTAVTHSTDPKPLWVKPEQRPWRQLPALMSFLDAEANDGFDCRLLSMAVPRATRATTSFSLWSGGLKVSSNAGEQYVSGKDDFVESEVGLHSSWLGKVWFNRFRVELNDLASLAKGLFGAVAGYYRELKADGAGQAAKASESFWGDCDALCQEIVDGCGESDDDALVALRERIAHHAEKRYDEACSREGARQIEAWAKRRVSTSQYRHGLDAEHAS
jgi:CRISPR system Cascade subunit CasA